MNPVMFMLTLRAHKIQTLLPTNNSNSNSSQPFLKSHWYVNKH